jgi:hypothetical protein
MARSDEVAITNDFPVGENPYAASELGNGRIVLRIGCSLGGFQRMV